MSIKKKFATAVATAGLLAGLFGSAFVPAAFATRTSAALPVAKYTEINEFGLVTNPKSGVFGYYSSDSDASADNAAEDLVAVNVVIKTSQSAYWDGSISSSLALTAASSNSAIKLTWALASSGGADSPCETRDDAKANFKTSDTVTGIASAPDGEYKLCFASAKSTSAATSTITVTAAGVVVSTFTMTAMGPVASVSVAVNDGKYIAGDNNYIDNWATIIIKDAAGTVLNGADNTVSDESSYTVCDSEEQVSNADGVIDATDGCTESQWNDALTHGAYDGLDLNDHVCNAADSYGDGGDEGKTYALKFNVDDVDSNAVSITCTGSAEFAKVTKVVAEVTSGDTDYLNADTEATDFAINATIVDADGRPLGNGAGSLSRHDMGLNGDKLPMTFAFKAGLDSCLNDNTTGFHTEAIDGVAEIGTLSPADCNPGKKSYSIVVANSDLMVTNGNGDDAVSKTFVLSYTAAFAGHDGDISRTRNKAKTRATITADFGETAAYGKVTFTVTTSTGVDQIFTRNADANGVATLVLNRRNTRIYVYADASDFSEIWVGSTGIIPVRFR